MAVAIAEVSRVVASRSKTPEGIRQGTELEKIRRSRDMTQRQLADALLMSEEGYRNYAKGYGRITRDTLPRWARALEMPVAELAQRLDIALLTDADGSGLHQELAEFMPDADAAELEDMARKLATLPPADRRQILEGWRDHLTGRLSRLGRE